jgi:hypothetical protein
MTTFSPPSPRAAVLSAFCEDETLRDEFFGGLVEPPATGRDITYIDWTTGMVIVNAIHLRMCVLKW